MQRLMLRNGRGTEVCQRIGKTPFISEINKLGSVVGESADLRFTTVTSVITISN